jgi:hypothetical protein
MSLKKFLAIAVIPFALLSGSLANGADIPDEQVVPGSVDVTGNRSNQYGVFFEESVDTLRMPSLLYGYNTRNNTMNAINFCDSLTDPNCSSATGFKYYALLPPCSNDVDVDCIQSVYAIPNGSPARIEGKFKKQMPAVVAKPYKGSLKDGLPQGGNAGIWTIPGVKHKGNGEDYAVIVSLVGDINKNTTSPIGDLRAVILPENMVTHPGYKANIAMITDNQSMGTKQVSISHTGSQSFEPCAIVEDGACALRQGFPDDVQFGLSIRLSKSLPGWLHGRIGNPQINYQEKSYGTFIEMQGLATKVPVVGGWIENTPANADLIAGIKKDTWLPNLGGGTFPGASGDQSMVALSAWSKAFNDKAIAYPSQWIFYNLPEYQLQSSNQCIRNSKTLAGFVTTNSTTYAAGPPVFNKATESLDYKVASPHFLKDGSTFLGDYNLYIDSKVARCIYQFTDAPISASVSIVNESGEAKVATTVMSEHAGWMHLSASGFTFSSPTLRVKLTQGTNAAPSQDSSAVATAIQKKVTISCAKGKTTKKVTAIKPACPSGWKKK